MATLRDVLPAASGKVASLLSIGLFAGLAGALFWLQVVETSHYAGLARDNYIVQAAIKAPRGEIVDRNGFVVAGSRQSFSICGVPRSLLKNEDEVRTLASILQVDGDFIRSRLKQTALSYRPTPIVRDVDFATLSLVEEMFADLPDIMVVSEPVRSYPRGCHFSHIIGYVGEVTQEEIKASPRTYLPGDFIGKSGVEKVYNGYLKGIDGQRYVQFSPGREASPVEVRYLPAKAPKQGMRLVLHADDGLQLLAHSLLKDRRGCIVVLDVRTGGVLAMASSPSFDPNLFATGISGPDWQRILESKGKPLINRAIQSSYPPGSVYKIVTAGSALERGLITKETRFQPCRGSYRFGNRDFACWKAEGHGSADLVEAISVSCDVYFYQLGERLGIDNFSASAAQWNLGRKTGIDLPAEIEGLIPDMSYYDRTYGKGRWTRGVMLNLAIGQGELLLTPVELLCFFCGIAHRGTYYVPRCAHRAELDGKTQSFDGGSVDLAMSQSTIDVLRESMLQVVEGPQGTGRVVRLPRRQVAGKTGTAQNPHGDDHASFICFAPFDDPEIAVSVMLENAGHGSVEAAPLAKEILSYYFTGTGGEEVAAIR